MSTIDQFESTFRSAVKPLYTPEKITLSNVLIISDCEAEVTQRFQIQLQNYLSALTTQEQSLNLQLLCTEQSQDLDQLLETINDLNPQLIVTHRHLHSQNKEHLYTLGDHIEVLTQITEVPILLFPKAIVQNKNPLEVPNKILILTDQLLEHPSLVDYALSFMGETGQLSLAHIEDEIQFERYMDMVSKIPEIDTESARNCLKEQMYKDAQDFFSVIDQSIKDEKLNIEVRASFRMGHKLKTYVSIASEDAVELVVIQGKDEDQIAMHGLSYPLAVELNHLPLLIV